MGSVKPIPEGYHNVTPYLFVRGATAAIDFYKKVFGATVIVSMPGPIGQVMHAELKIGDSMIMLSDENPKTGAMSPQTAGGISSRKCEEPRWPRSRSDLQGDSANA